MYVASRPPTKTRFMTVPIEEVSVEKPVPVMYSLGEKNATGVVIRPEVVTSERVPMLFPALLGKRYYRQAVAEAAIRGTKISICCIVLAREDAKLER